MNKEMRKTEELKYSAPKLVVYGGMAALTASGSNGTNENMGSMSGSGFMA